MNERTNLIYPYLFIQTTIFFTKASEKKKRMERENQQSNIVYSGH